MLKIPEEGKLIDAGKFYREVYRTYTIAKDRFTGVDKADLPDFVRFGEAVTGLIGELAYDFAPADAKPVVHGKWLAREYEDGGSPYVLFHCSECDYPNARQRAYCPECGAKMDRV